MIDTRIPQDYPLPDDEGSQDPLPTPPQGDIDCGEIAGEHLELQIRRGPTSDRLGFIPLVGEPIFDTTESVSMLEMA